MNTSKRNDVLIVHGTPTVPLRFEHGCGRVRIFSDEAGYLVWESYGLAAGCMHVSVDTDNGNFLDKIGRVSGEAILAEGVYQAEWHECDGSQQKIDSFQVVAKTLFELDCVDAESLSETGWILDGRWRPGHNELMADSKQSFAFHEGAMHGRLSANFRIPDSGDHEQYWGLIARHYNAFLNMRVVCQLRGNKLFISLIRCESASPPSESHTVIAQRSVALADMKEFELRWEFNGAVHSVFINSEWVLDAKDNWMGGVDIVGFFAECGGAALTHIVMDTTQYVPAHIIDRPEYIARIRPGNIASLVFRDEGKPTPNICWESGIQFGHIGGSEIKFSQQAMQEITDDGNVFTCVKWSGPMPKFVEQSHDVRGMAEGRAFFYPNRIVIDDKVLAWVRRSVGPDIDLLGRMLCGPAKLAIGSESTFRQWILPKDGTSNFVNITDKGKLFPAIILFPLKLKDEFWWLKVLVDLRYPISVPTVGFAWQCQHGLTASHDFRAAPNEPGREYAFSIILGWQKDGDEECVKREMLSFRDDWITPANIEVTKGQAVIYEGSTEHQKEALDFLDCFDRASGQYVFVADQGELRAKIDPISITRKGLILNIRNWQKQREVGCSIDGRKLSIGEDYIYQFSPSCNVTLYLHGTFKEPFELYCYCVE